MNLNNFSFSPIEINMAVVIFNLTLATILGFAIAFTHQRTRNGLSYSQSFFATLVLITVIAAVIMTIVANNIFGALGLLGAFTFIRFRTIIKETRDIAFVFFALAEGIAAGLGHFATAIISTFIIALIAYAIYKFNLGSVIDKKCILLITASSPLDQNSINEKLNSVEAVVTMLSSKRRQDGLFDYTFSVTGKQIDFLDKTISELTHSLPITQYDLISGKESIEY